MEVWKPIPKRTPFEASSSGRIRNGLTLNVATAFLDKKGYPSVKIQRQTYTVRTLVARAFLGEPPPGHKVRNKDGNTNNNAVENLEYRPWELDPAYARKMFLEAPDVASGIEHLTWRQVVEIAEAYKPRPSCKALAEKFDTCEATIQNIVNNKTWPKEFKDAR